MIQRDELTIQQFAEQLDIVGATVEVTAEGQLVIEGDRDEFTGTFADIDEVIDHYKFEGILPEIEIEG